MDQSAGPEGVVNPSPVEACASAAGADAGVEPPSGSSASDRPGVVVGVSGAGAWLGGKPGGGGATADADGVVVVVGTSGAWLGVRPGGGRATSDTDGGGGGPSIGVGRASGAARLPDAGSTPSDSDVRRSPRVTAGEAMSCDMASNVELRDE